MRINRGKKCIAFFLCFLLLSAALPFGVRAEGEKESYTAQLSARGFPTSYHEALWTLHQAYPQWDFQVQKTSLGWTEALAGQTVLGVSLVAGSAASSWKSTQEGAYNWSSSTWVELDSGGWVAASEAIVAYYMDPRNFLGEKDIFQFLHQGYDSAVQTREGLQTMVKGTFLADGDLDTDADDTNGVTTYVDSILAAAEQSGISPYVLCSIILQEQGRNGQSASILGTNSRFPNLYNYFNIGAYQAAGFTAVERGLWYASGGNNASTSYGRPWDTPAKAILGGAEYYAKNYMEAGQTTLYLKRFNVQGEKPCTHQYMTNVAGARSEGQTLAAAYTDELRSAGLCFYIPVFEGMPGEACPLPSGNGSVNARLASLEVAGCVLTPEFSRDVTEYTAVVAYETDAVEIRAAACDSEASVSGTGLAALEVGANVITLTVRAGNGETETYTLRLARQAQMGETPVPEPEAPAETPVPTEPPTPAETPAPAETQQRLGDADGDGNIAINDLIRVRNHILGTVRMEGVAMTAADVNGDGSIAINDLIRIRNHILGTVPLA